MSDQNPPPSIQDSHKLASMYGQWLDRQKRTQPANPTLTQPVSRNRQTKVIDPLVPIQIENLNPPEGLNYISILTAYGSAGKLIDLDANGNPTKTPLVAFSERWAKTVELQPNEPLNTVYELLKNLGTNQCFQTGILPSRDHMGSYLQFQ